MDENWGYPYFRKSPYVSICVSLLINMLIYHVILIQLRTLVWLLCSVFVYIRYSCWFGYVLILSQMTGKISELGQKADLCQIGGLLNWPPHSTSSARKRIQDSLTTCWGPRGWADTWADSNWMDAIGGCKHVWLYVPSGKCLHNYGKSPFLMGKSSINGHFQ